MKKILMSIALICALLLPQTTVMAARTDCTVSLNNAYYKMTNGSTGGSYPELVITTSGSSVNNMAFHLILDGAEWDYNKMSRIDSNISVTSSASNDIQLKFKSEFFKTQNEGKASSFTVPLYAKNFSDGYVYLSVTDTPNYMDNASFLFACNTTGTFSAKYDQKADIYRSGVSTLSDITIIDTASFAALPGETSFTITLGSNSYSFENTPEVTGTGKYEGKVTAVKDSAYSVTISISEATDTGTGNIVVSNLKINAVSSKITASPDISVYSKRKLNFTTNEGTALTRTVDAKNTFSAGNFIKGAAITDVTASSSAVTAETEETDSASTLSFTVGDNAYILNGERVEISAACIVSEGRTMLPVRALAEALNADNIVYDAETKTALIVKAQTNVSIEQNGDYMYINGEQKEVTSPAVNQNGSMYLPVRDICEAFGITDISFDAETKTVTIRF